MTLFYIGFFGLLGVLARYGTAIVTARFLPSTFPWGTFIINMVGALAIGIVYECSIERSQLSPELRMGIMVGFLGGFTTFSAYALESIRLLQTKHYWHFALYGGLSPVLGMVLAAVGILATRKILG